MSDFDKFLGDKLDEEGQFPRRDKNWERLSQRLDTFDAMAQQQTGWRSSLRWWQVAAVGALAVGVILFFRMHTVQRENAELRQQMEGLQQKNGTPTVPVASATENNAPATGHAGANPSKQDTNQRTTERLSSRSPEPLKSDVFPARRSADTPLKEQKSRNLAGKIKDTTPTTKPGTTVEAPVAASANDSKTSDSTTKDIAQPSNPPVNDIATQEVNSPVPSTTDSLQNVAASASPDSIRQAPASQPDPKISEPQLADLPLSQPDTLATAAAPPKIIEPVKNRFRRIQAGVQAIVGMPQPRQSGVSLITGQGVTAEFAPLRRLWVTASADWLRFDVNTQEYQPRFHHSHQEPPKPPQPGPGGPKHELVEVESNQRQQQYGLGLRYQLPFNGWIRPSVRVAHTWVRVSPSFVSFKFEEEDNGPNKPHEEPKYFVRKEAAKQLSNLWRFGAGLEHETARWTFGLWADYSKNLATVDATFDALYVQGGVKYRL